MNKGIISLVCETGNYPDGQKIDRLRAIYPGQIDQSTVGADSFEVPGRSIVSVRAEGCEALIELDPNDESAPVIPCVIHKGPPPGGPGGPGAPGAPGGPGGPPRFPPKKRRKIQLELIQKRDILSVEGETFTAFEQPRMSDGVREPVVEDFTQHIFRDLNYNLFTPETAQGEVYPLVVFLHDAGVCGDEPKLTLSQGSGAVCWASPGWQREHPCFVLAPQIAAGRILTADDFTVDEQIETIKQLIEHICENPLVDSRRVYLTGQSMGCMSFCELNARYPERFAASLLVAGQWSPEKMAASCSRCRFWILVSQHDQKAYPGMNAVTAAMEAAGAKLGRYIWNAKSTQEEFDLLVEKAAKDGANIHYTVFEGGSVVAPGREDNAPENHMGTWPVVYGIDALKRWLFSN